MLVNYFRQYGISKQTLLHNVILHVHLPNLFQEGCSATNESSLKLFNACFKVNVGPQAICTASNALLSAVHITTKCI